VEHFCDLEYEQKLGDQKNCSGHITHTKDKKNRAREEEEELLL
jgi:hypothetical protein